MQKFFRSVIRAGICMALVICIISGFRTAASGLSDGVAPDITGGSYITTVHAANDSDNEALIDFYKEKVDKLNNQCNILLVLCILLLAALIISRLIQPQQNIYEVEKTAKKKKKKDLKKNPEKEERGDVFEDAVEGANSQERYTVQQEVAEDSKDISDNLKL